jgi:hypothetical protein
LACNKKKLSLTAAYAAITYPADILAGLPGATGQLIYIKPWLPAEAPIELLSYKQVKPNFPHEPTEDQFFTESDFESYRRLGEFVVNTMLTKLLTKKLLTKELDEDKLASLFDQAARQPKPDHAPAAPNPKKPTPTPAKQSTCG